MASCSGGGPPIAVDTTPAASAAASSPAPPTTHAPTPTPKPVYKPATADGPAQNVPVPVLPAKAKEFSKAGLEAFATYWYSTLGYAYETGDATPMMAITDTECTTCTGVRDMVTTWYGEGGWIRGGQMIVYSSTSTFYKTPDDTYQAVLMIQQKQVTSYKADKTIDSDLPKTDARADILVATYEQGHWTTHKAEHLTKD
ncbi:DUF6318 family protein [Arthrobacter sp. ERGS1:01]|uniref:DUF6318 family protein n=1 Tax=Arthrobacter sp. ERGS1:01 TaxID=1704044 RepID=UPI000AB9D67A|nr:DUF6318 family protein [Arthrobacter sp. ERGS1:01]